jgi:hypothetical protein
VSLQDRPRQPNSSIGPRASIMKKIATMAPAPSRGISTALECLGLAVAVEIAWQL